MKVTEFPDPDPRDHLLEWTEFEYPVARTILLDPPDSLPPVGAFDVLDQRRTRRQFQRLVRTEVSHVLWFSAKCRAALKAGNSYVWQHAPAPSAGGCHPIDILIGGIAGEERAIFLYEPISHALRELACRDETARVRLEEIATSVTRCDGSGTTFWFGSQPARTASRYTNPETLIWRDSGALAATMAIAAEALSLNCCALGPSGHPWVADLVGGRGRIVGIGGCVLGSRGLPPPQPPE